MSDVANYPEVLTQDLRSKIIQTGANQSDIKFPSTAGRSFSSKYYIQILANGEKIKREWLCYSKKNDAVHCFCCLIFGVKYERSGLCSRKGYNDWKHLSQAIQTHEKSSTHLDSFNNWKEHLERSSTGTTVEICLETQLSDERKRLKLVFERFVAITMYLARQNLAFTNANTTSGNFYELVKTIAQFDSVLKSHLMDDQRNKYLSPSIQNELIGIIGEKIRRNILNEVIQSKYYGMILDCTPDISRKEQMVLVLRYVHFDTSKRLFEIKESYIEFLNITESTGEAIADTTVKKLNQLGLDVNNMRAQAYDNGSNMKGIHRGVQKRIRDLNSLAWYYPCSNHSLNLSLNDTASASGEIYGFFSIIQQIFTFLSGSTLRWDVLKNHCSLFKDLTPKPLSTTRWSSRLNAVKPFRRNLRKILGALEEISKSESFQSNVRFDAETLIDQIDFKFICSVCIWHDVLEQFDRVCKVLQKIETNVATSIFLLRDINEFLASYLTSGYEKVIEEATIIADGNEIPATFFCRRRGRPRNIDPEEAFKTEFFEFMINVAQNSIKDRFESLEAHSETFSFLYEFEHLEERYANGSLLRLCTDFERALKWNEQSDVDGNELCNELRIVGKMVMENEISHIIDILNLIAKKRLENVLPNCVIAYRILLTIPVSVASGERSFSKLKIIKNYLRNTMGQERLSNLAIISIESEQAQLVNYDEVISSFAHAKARKCTF